MTSFTALIDAIVASGGTCNAHIPEDWQQGRTTFGGLSAALCVAAAERLVPDLPPLRAAQFTFIGPAGGDVEMSVRVLRRGKSSAFVAVELQSGGAIATHALLTCGATRDSAYSFRAHPLPSVPAPGTTAPLFGRTAPNFARHFDTCIAGGHRLVSGAAKPDILVWLRHRDPLAMSCLPGVIALGDTPPVAAYTMLKTPVPVSSITWSIEVIDAAAARRAPGDAWYLLRSVGDDVREGYSVQDMALWAEDGTLVTLARQTVGIFG